MDVDKRYDKILALALHYIQRNKQRNTQYTNEICIRTYYYFFIKRYNFIAL